MKQGIKKSVLGLVVCAGSTDRGRPLRTGAYLLLKVDLTDGVESFEEVLRKDIPPDIADMLDEQPNTITS